MWSRFEIAAMLIPEIVSGGGGERWQAVVRAVDGFSSLDLVCLECARYGGDRGVRNPSCAEQFRAIAFAPFNYRESLRDIEACLGAQPAKLYPWALVFPSDVPHWPRPTRAATGVSTRSWRDG